MAHLAFFKRSSSTDQRSGTTKRSIGVLLVAGLATAVLLGAFSRQGPAAQASGPLVRTPLQPYGLIAMEQYPGCDFAKTTPCPAVPLPAGAAGNPAIAGLMLRVTWMDMQPSSGDDSTTNWQITDEVFSQAEESTSISQPRGPSGPTAQKFVVLAFVPGFDTPAWALKGVQTASFCTPYGVGAGTSATLPVPWDATYQAEWSTFLQQVATHYAGKQDLLMIAADGPTSVSAEMSLPGAEDSAKSKCSKAEITADQKTWEGLAPPYTPSTYVGAWTAAFNQYALDFPGQYTSLSLYPGLPIPNKSQSKATPESVVSSGAAAFGANFALQANGLAYDSGGPDDSMYQLVSENSGKMVTGFQLIDSATDVSHWSTEGGPSATTAAQSLQNALDAGLSSKAGVATNVDFLEIYDQDASSSDASVQSVLQNVAGQLPLPQYSPAYVPPPSPRPSCGPDRCT